MAAEVELRKALRIDPLNEVAKRYVEEIRSTEVVYKVTNEFMTKTFVVNVNPSN